MTEEFAEYVGRKSWDWYFLEIAKQVATRSTCLRRHVGAVAVKDKRILATGYNGAPAGLPHCEEQGCLRERMQIPSGERLSLCRGVHAEQNVICQAARFGISLKNTGMYIHNGTPCLQCAKFLINVGIDFVVADSGYPNSEAMSMLKQAGISVEVM